ncbi:MAG: DUF3021 family protein [Lactococcus sp.]
MKTFKTFANTAAISIASCTILSALAYSILGRGSFQLITPFTIQTSTPAYNAVISLIIYIYLGIFIQTTVNLFKQNQFGLNKKTLISFFINVIVLSILGIATSAPWGIPLHYWSDYYLSDKTAAFYFLVTPWTTTLIGFSLVYLVLFFYYRIQIKKLNQKIISKASSTHSSEM